MNKLVLWLYVLALLALANTRRWFPINRNGDRFTNLIITGNNLLVTENGMLHILDSELISKGNISTCLGVNCENVNKILLNAADLLILAGTGSGGIFQAWNGSMFVYKSSSNVSDDNYLVVSSDISRPAVGLIHEDNLYVGATYGEGIVESHIGISRSYKYLISKTLYKANFKLKAYAYLNDGLHEQYVVYFRKVFRNENFVYFLTNQRKGLLFAEYESKLIRICSNETFSNNDIKSYTDITLSCEVDGIRCNLLQDADYLPATKILTAVFSKGGEPQNPNTESAVCIYTLEAINDAIRAAKKDYITCADQNNTKGSYLPSDLGYCLRSMEYEMLEADFICPSGFGIKVMGRYILQHSSSLKIVNITGRITKVKGIDRYNLYSDFMLGTNTGSTMKLAVDQALNMHVYDPSTVVDIGHAVVDLQIGEDFVYVLTDRKLFKLEREKCSYYRSYMDTIKSRNPSCGWCTSEFRSTKKYECTSEWLSSMSKPATIEVSPKYIRARSDRKNLTIKGTNLPRNRVNNMKCVLRDERTMYGAPIHPHSISLDIFICTIRIMHDYREILVNLQDNHAVYAVDSITFYKCETFKRFGYKCAVNLFSQVTEFDAVAESKSLISCRIMISLDGSFSKITFPFAMYQVNGSTVTEIDSEYSQYVTVYNCERIAGDCTMCASLVKSRYDCNWCGNHCSHRAVCNESAACPSARIKKVEPSEGGNKGYTTITIGGTDFGSDVNEIQRVMIGDRNCYRITPEISNNTDFYPYITSIRCQIERFVRTAGESHPITIRFRREQIKGGSYTFQEPVITSISPNFANILGGAKITLQGRNLRIGNVLKDVRFGNVRFGYVSCKDALYEQQSIICFTNSVNSPFKTTNVRIRLDDEVYQSDLEFRFIPAPEITDIPDVQKSILSGGVNITIRGENLNNAAKRSITASYAGSEMTNDCEGISQKQLMCPLPEAPERVKAEMEENLNSVKSPLTIHLDRYQYTFRIEYYRDPILLNFDQPDSLKEIGLYDRELNINGNHLDVAAKMTDYKVNIGTNKLCIIIALTNRTITCLLPSLSDTADKKQSVKIRLGNFEAAVGYIIYRTEKEGVYNSVILIIGITVSTVLVVLTIIGTIIGCIMYRRASSRIPKIIKNKPKVVEKKEKTGKNTFEMKDLTTGQLSQVYEELDARGNLEGNDYSSLEHSKHHQNYEGLDIRNDAEIHVYSSLENK